MFTQAITVTVTSDTTTENFRQFVTEGKVQFHRERANGTFRRVHFLADGTTEREHAEWLRAERENGRTMRALATETNYSIATLRRWLNDLALTESIEEADAEELADMIKGAYELDEVTDGKGEDEPQEEKVN